MDIERLESELAGHRSALQHAVIDLRAAKWRRENGALAKVVLDGFEAKLTAARERVERAENALKTAARATSESKGEGL